MSSQSIVFCGNVISLPSASARRLRKHCRALVGDDCQDSASNSSVRCLVFRRVLRELACEETHVTVAYHPSPPAVVCLEKALALEREEGYVPDFYLSTLLLFVP